jgi:hypothetical protein
MVAGIKRRARGKCAKKNDVIENLLLPMLRWIFVTIGSAPPNIGVKSVCCSIWYVLA